MIFGCCCAVPLPLMPEDFVDGVWAGSRPEPLGGEETVGKSRLVTASETGVVTGLELIGEGSLAAVVEGGAVISGSAGMPGAVAVEVDVGAGENLC